MTAIERWTTMDAVTARCPAALLHMRTRVVSRIDGVESERVRVVRPEGFLTTDELLL